MQSESDPSRYLRTAVSNGDAEEQALIRWWWHETHGARGRVVWEYRLEGRFIDAIWFPSAEGAGTEAPGLDKSTLFPLDGLRVTVCEAKKRLGPELIGQALVYARLATRAGATVEKTIVLAQHGDRSMQEVAAELGLTVVLRPMQTA